MLQKPKYQHCTNEWMKGNNQTWIKLQKLFVVHQMDYFLCFFNNFIEFYEDFLPQFYLLFRETFSLNLRRALVRIMRKNCIFLINFCLLCSPLLPIFGYFWSSTMSLSVQSLLFLRNLVEINAFWRINGCLYAKLNRVMLRQKWDYYFERAAWLIEYFWMLTKKALTGLCVHLLMWRRNNVSDGIRAEIYHWVLVFLRLFWMSSIILQI